MARLREDAARRGRLFRTGGVSDGGAGDFSAECGVRSVEWGNRECRYCAREACGPPGK
jgi:hypothetical protein